MTISNFVRIIQLSINFVEYLITMVNFFFNLVMFTNNISDNKVLPFVYLIFAVIIKFL